MTDANENDPTRAQHQEAAAAFLERLWAAYTFALAARQWARADAVVLGRTGATYRVERQEQPALVAVRRVSGGVLRA